MASPFAAQPLPTRAVIRLTGEAPLAFLHNLLTCDVSALPDHVWAYGALLSPQGKIQHDIFVIRDGETVFVDCAASQRRSLLQKLMLYRLRAKIEIAMDDAHGVAVGTRDGIVAPDPRLDAMGTRAIIPAGSIPAGKGYDAVRIIHGLADSTADIGENVLFPHEANLDQLNGVSFSKGCYVGQEVVSRMQHRGTARSRILPVSASAPLPAKGTEIRAGDVLAGEMLSSAGSTGLALLRLDRLADAKEPLLTGSVTLQIHKPQWMTIPIPVTNTAR